MLKFIRALFNTKQTIQTQNEQIVHLTRQLAIAKQEAEKWRLKYENAKEWINEISNDFHSYEDGDD